MNPEDTETPNDTTTEAVTDSPADAAETKPESGVAAFDKGVSELSESEGGIKPAEAAEPAPAVATSDAADGTAVAGKNNSPENDEKIIKEALADAELKKFNDELRAAGSKPLSKAAASRFRELSMRPTPAELEKRLAEAQEKFVPREELAQTADRMNEVIADCGANPQQIGSVFRYLKDINSGDPASMKRAFDSMKQELTWLGEQLGESVDGADPLAAHPDLKTMVAEGDMKMAAALEVAQARATKRLHEQRANQQETQTAQEREAQAAIAKRDLDLSALDQHLKKTDSQYLEKLPYLQQTFAVLKRTNAHPSQWVDAIKEAYALVRLPEKPKAAATPSPMRSTGITPTVMKIPKDGLQAFDLGIASLDH